MTDTTVGQLVAERPSRARVFERYGIDYCCGGKRPLREACAEKGLDPAEIGQAIAASDAASAAGAETDWTRAGLAELADHIEATHHAYLREELPRLTQLLEKISRVHGPNHPEMLDVERVFGDLRNELEMHMQKEEQILFPIVRTLEKSDGLPSFHCGSIQNPIRVMEFEHDNAGNALETMRKLTHDYTPPPDACNTFRATLSSLAELEADMHQHVHKENNILFPRAIELENRLGAESGAQGCR